MPGAVEEQVSTATCTAVSPCLLHAGRPQLSKQGWAVVLAGARSSRVQGGGCTDGGCPPERGRELGFGSWWGWRLGYDGDEHTGEG